VTPPQQNSEGLNKSDSIGFVGIILGIIAVTVDPTPPLKLGLLLIACVCSIIFIWKSHWTYKLSVPTKFLVMLIVVAVLWIRAIIQVLGQISLFAPVLRFLSRLRLYIASPGARLFEAAIFGAASMLILLILLSKLQASLNSRERRTIGTKGFLDYKLDAESAIAEIPVMLKPISAILGEVGQMMETDSARILTTPVSATSAHLKNIQALALKLETSTRRLAPLVSKFKIIANKFAEGITGWSAWMRQQSGAEQNKALFVAVTSTFALNNRAAMLQTELSQHL
jgi:hypothetical protein